MNDNKKVQVNVQMVPENKRSLELAASYLNLSVTSAVDVAVQKLNWFCVELQQDLIKLLNGEQIWLRDLGDGGTFAMAYDFFGIDINWLNDIYKDGVNHVVALTIVNTFYGTVDLMYNDTDSSFGGMLVKASRLPFLIESLRKDGKFPFDLPIFVDGVKVGELKSEINKKNT